jgi:hypothetical protein
MTAIDIETFSHQIAEATKQYDRAVVCLEKLPDDFEDSLSRLVQKAIVVYNNRASNQRHGIALDRHITVMLSQSDSDVPLCGIYFNLSSPYLNDTRIRSTGFPPATP